MGGQIFVQAMRRLCPSAQLTCIDPLVVSGVSGPVAYLPALVNDIDFDKKVVHAASGLSVEYDALVLSPGADVRWDQIEGYTASAIQRMPHGWIGKERGRVLKARLVSLSPGETVVIYIPNGVIRFPEAVDLRISSVSHYLLENKPGSKLLVLDARANQLGAPDSAGNTEWLLLRPDDDIVRVDPEAGTLHSTSLTYRGDLVNFIPPQRAGAIACRHGLTDVAGWCPVEPSSGRSLRADDVYVLGDASAADSHIKSGMSAGRQAIRCADYLAGIA
jgi:sulfide dehydrogenase [flavocytochrome c] flavoprotein subunit